MLCRKTASPSDSPFCTSLACPCHASHPQTALLQHCHLLFVKCVGILSLFVVRDGRTRLVIQHSHQQTNKLDPKYRRLRSRRGQPYPLQTAGHSFLVGIRLRSSRVDATASSARPQTRLLNLRPPSPVLIPLGHPWFCDERKAVIPITSHTVV